MGRYPDDVPLPDRAPFDFYPTARVTVLDGLHTVSRRRFAPRRVLDPGAGMGVWGEAAHQRWPCSHITGVELQDFAAPASYDVWLRGCFQDIAPTLQSEFDLVMGNPPFDQSEEFVRLALALLAPRGRLIFLLKLSFETSQGRGWNLFREYPPRWKFPCSLRPSFGLNSKGKRGTAIEEYAFFIWEAGFQGTTETIWLPKDETAATWKRKGPGRPRIYPNGAARKAACLARKKAGHVP